MSGYSGARTKKVLVHEENVSGNLLSEEPVLKKFPLIEMSDGIVL